MIHIKHAHTRPSYPNVSLSLSLSSRQAANHWRRLAHPVFISPRFNANQTAQTARTAHRHRRSQQHRHHAGHEPTRACTHSSLTHTEAHQQVPPASTPPPVATTTHVSVHNLRHYSSPSPLLLPFSSHGAVFFFSPPARLFFPPLQGRHRATSFASTWLI